MEERKRHILRAVIDDFIATGEPVGSRAVARRHGFDVSPATIRNEMADLEDLGYLEQPHTSAGRMPSDSGYRFYVDHLVPAEVAAAEARAGLRALMAARARAAGAGIRTAARLLSEASSFLGLVSGPPHEAAAIDTARIAPLKGNRALFAVVTDSGRVEHHIISLERPLPPDEVAQLNELLDERLSGLSMGDAAERALQRLSRDLHHRGDIIEQVLLLLKEAPSEAEERLFMGGATNMLRQPEFRDVDKAQLLLSSLEQEDMVLDLLGDVEVGMQVRVVIGHELPVAELHDCSLVSAGYRMGGQAWGQVAVLGPRRMDYARMMALVQVAAAMLSDNSSRS